MNQRLAKSIGAALESGNLTMETAALTILRDALEQSRGNITHAARILGVSSRSLKRWAAENQAVSSIVSTVRNNYDTNVIAKHSDSDMYDTHVIAETSDNCDSYDIRVIQSSETSGN